MKPKTHFFNLRLLKKDVTLDSALNPNSDLEEYSISSSLPFSGKIFVNRTALRKTNWSNLLQSFASINIRDLTSSASSAVLIIEIQNRLFAFTFGHGRYLLASDCHVSDFGLKVTLNAVDPDQLLSVDARTIDEAVITTSRQSSRTLTIESFGLNIARDLLRGVAGCPRDYKLAKKLFGSESLAFAAEMDIKELGAKCEQFLKEYGKKIYRDRFSWIDNLGVIKEKGLINDLNLDLVKYFRSESVERIFLAPPELIDWNSFQGFGFESSRKSDRILDKEFKSDLKIEDYKKTFVDLAKIDLHVLKADKAIMAYGESEQLKYWSVFNCIVFEMEVGNAHYVLVESTWYKVEKIFLEKKNKELADIEEWTIQLPPLNINEREDDYNKRVVSGNQKYVLMDSKLIMIEGRSKIEFCDLFSSDCEIIHIKKRGSGPANLSHLFAQGRVSGLTFLEMSDFRKEIKIIIQNEDSSIANLIPVGSVDSSKFNIVFAFISGVREVNWREELPFFSRINLIDTWHYLKRMGYKVSVCRINKN